MKLFNDENYILILLILCLFLGLGVWFLFRPSGDNVKNESTELEISGGLFEKLFGRLKLSQTREYGFECVKVYEMPNRGIVEGNKGEYFRIDFLNSKTRETVFFKPEEFSIPDFDMSFLEAINEFKAKVYQAVDSLYNVQVFVQGSADISGDVLFKEKISKETSKEMGFLDFSYLPRISDYGSMYESYPQNASVIDTFTNKELPNMRARFLQQKLAVLLGGKKVPIILEGSVINDRGSEYMNATVYLFVEGGLRKEY